MENNNVMNNEELKVVEEIAKIPEFDLEKGLKYGAIGILGTGLFVALVKLIKKYGWPKVKKAIENVKTKRAEKKSARKAKKATVVEVVE